MDYEEKNCFSNSYFYSLEPFNEIYNLFYHFNCLSEKVLLCYFKVTFLDKSYLVRLSEIVIFLAFRANIGMVCPFALVSVLFFCLSFGTPPLLICILYRKYL